MREMNEDPSIEIIDEEDVETFELDADTSSDVEAVIEDALEAVAGVSDDAGAETSAAAAEQLADLGAQLKAANERAMRSLADLENYRKRVTREREEERRYASTDVLRDILPVVDNLERALAAGGSTEDLKSGVELTLREFIALLGRRGVTKVATVGERFDPTVHEAVSRHEDPQATQVEVSEVFQSGYVLHERLLRPAVVKVVMPPTAGQNKGGSA